MAVSKLNAVSGTVTGQINSMGGSLTYTRDAGTLNNAKSVLIDLGGSLPASTYNLTFTYFNYLTSNNNSKIIVNGVDASGNKIFTGFSGSFSSTIKFTATSSFNKISISGGGLIYGSNSLATTIVITPGSLSTETVTSNSTWTMGANQNSNSGAVSTVIGSGGYNAYGFLYGAVYRTGTTHVIWTNASGYQTVGKLVDANGTLTGSNANANAAGGYLTYALDSTNGTFYWGGGRDSTNTGIANTNTNWYSWAYNGNNTSQATMPDNYTNGPSSIFANGKIYVLGGSRYVSGTRTTETAARFRSYDIAGNSWTTLTSAPAGYGINGDNYNDQLPAYYDSATNRIFFAFDNSLVAYYDITAGTWTTTGNAPSVYNWGVGSVGKWLTGDSNFWYGYNTSGGAGAVRYNKTGFNTINNGVAEGLYSFTNTVNINAMNSTYMNNGGQCIGVTSDGTNIYVYGFGNHNNNSAYLRVQTPIASMATIPTYAQ